MPGVLCVEVALMVFGGVLCVLKWCDRFVLLFRCSNGITCVCCSVSLSGVTGV